MNDTDFDKAFIAIVGKLERGPRDLLSMVDIRRELAALGLEREEQDEHIKRLSKEGLLVVNPETRFDHRTDVADEAAITVGGSEEPHPDLAAPQLTGTLRGGTGRAPVPPPSPQHNEPANGGAVRRPRPQDHRDPPVRTGRPGADAARSRKPEDKMETTADGITQARIDQLHAEAEAEYVAWGVETLAAAARDSLHLDYDQLCDALNAAGINWRPTGRQIARRLAASTVPEHVDLLGREVRIQRETDGTGYSVVSIDVRF
ncbi:hypothetical protein [Amycolatopsis sp. NPDC004079]|uniref:hypothetical protein n=1 Tax=Amycolatopsis sp. NPDC004079 TaxID=3154549 RepID=UPI0033BD7DCB